MEEQDYSPEHKQAILRAFAVWKGTKGAFCQLQGIHQATLKAWEEGRLQRAVPQLWRAKGFGHPAALQWHQSQPQARH